MKSTKILLFIIMVVAMVLVSTMFTTIYAKASNQAASMSVTNIQTAYATEMNAQATYMAYAKKADDEGYAKVGSLFRALAMAEKVHSDKHASILKDLGVTPMEKTLAPMVKSTKENLQMALQDENNAGKNLYPKYAKQASKDKIAKAPHEFSIFAKAEGVHAKLISEMINDPTNWSGKVVKYYVCPTCGNTIKDRPLACPICFTSGKKFMEVS